jgi:hypothetical protein
VGPEFMAPPAQTRAVAQAENAPAATNHLAGV